MERTQFVTDRQLCFTAIFTMFPFIVVGEVDENSEQKQKVKNYQDVWVYTGTPPCFTATFTTGDYFREFSFVFQEIVACQNRANS